MFVIQLTDIFFVLLITYSNQNLKILIFFASIHPLTHLKEKDIITKLHNASNLKFYKIFQIFSK